MILLQILGAVGLAALTGLVILVLVASEMADRKRWRR